MQRVGDEYTVIDGNGNGVNAATVTVIDSVTQVALPLLYMADGAIPTPASRANPIVTDAIGRWAVALPDGRYDFRITGGNITTYTIKSVSVYDNTITVPSPALGTVTSVALALPSILTVSGSPVTGVGTLTGTLATQTANFGWFGPATAPAAAPTFRAMVLADLPAFGPTASTVFGSATQVAQVTTNGQGIITAITNVTVTPAFASLTTVPTSVGGYGILDGVKTIFRGTASVTIGNTAAETSLVSTGAGSATIGANALVAGSTIIFRVLGYHTQNAAAPTIRIRLKHGATVLLDTTALVDAQLAAAPASHPFELSVFYTVRTVGAGGTGIGQVFMTSMGAAAATVGNTHLFPPAGFTATSAIDTTVGGLLDLTWQWGAADAALTITQTNCLISVEG